MNIKDLVLLEVVGGGELVWKRTEELIEEIPCSNLADKLVDGAMDFISETCHVGRFDPIGTIYEIITREAEELLGFGRGKLFGVYFNYLDSSIYIRQFDKTKLSQAYTILNQRDKELVKYVLAEAGVNVDELENQENRE